MSQHVANNIINSSIWNIGLHTSLFHNGCTERPEKENEEQWLY